MTTEGHNNTKPTPLNISSAAESKPAVNDAPLSPVKDAQLQKSLENHLAHRPGREELVEKHILPAGNAAPALLEKQKELEKSMLQDKLDGALKHRPDREELIEKNILPAGNAAPGLVEKQKELEKRMKSDKLDGALKHRPTPDDLVKKGVLHDDPRTAEEKYEEAIEEEYAKREGGA